MKLMLLSIQNEAQTSTKHLLMTSFQMNTRRPLLASLRDPYVVQDERRSVTKPGRLKALTTKICSQICVPLNLQFLIPNAKINQISPEVLQAASRKAWQAVVKMIWSKLSVLVT